MATGLTNINKKTKDDIVCGVAEHKVAVTVRNFASLRDGLSTDEKGRQRVYISRKFEYRGFTWEVKIDPWGRSGAGGDCRLCARLYIRLRDSEQLCDQTIDAEGIIKMTYPEPVEYPFYLRLGGSVYGQGRDICNWNDPCFSGWKSTNPAVFNITFTSFEVTKGSTLPSSSPPVVDLTEPRGTKRKTESILHSANCAICVDIIKNPLITPCGHTFCDSCLTTWFKAKSGNRCPACGTTFKIEKCARDYALSNILKELDKNPFLCDDDDEDESASSSSSLSSKKPDNACFNYRNCRKAPDTYCLTCKKYICQDCHAKYHQRNSLTRTHTLASCKPTFCLTHGERHTHYCTVCRELNCIYCAFNSHNDHRDLLISFEQHVADLREELNSSAAHIPKQIETLKALTDEIDAKIQDLVKQREEASSSISRLDEIQNRVTNARDDQLIIQSEFDKLLTLIKEATLEQK